MEFLHTRIAHDDQVATMSLQEKEAHEERKKQEKTDHPGCMMSGFLMVNRLVTRAALLYAMCGAV